MDRIINFDHGAAAQVLPEVFESMKPYFEEKFGNPSSVHNVGQGAKQAVEKARSQVAQLINADPREIFFTASGSESNNFAVKGVAFANRKKGNHIVLSAIEHFSVLQSAKALKKLGYEVTEVSVDSTGLIDPDDVKKAITNETIFVSVMHANNEIGTIEPIKEISRVTREKGVLFHTDAVQTVGMIPVDVNDLDVDLLSFSAQTFYGPQGAAGIYIRKGTRVNPLIDGGVQEGGRRAGTENVPAIVGMGLAAELAEKNLARRAEYVKKLRDKLITGIESTIDHVHFHGHRELRLPNNVSVGFEFIEGESILLFLGMNNIIASSGSACTSKALKASHVLIAVGVSHEIANGTILFTPGIDNTEADVDLLLEKLPPVVQRLREMSPLYTPA